jgi:hypothetical protein
MDEQPGQRQRDGQQHPASQPAREKYPHDEVPSSGPRSRLCRGQHPRPPRRRMDRPASRPGSCPPGTFRCSRPRYPQCGVVITTPMRPMAAQGNCRVMSPRADSKPDPGCSAGQMVIARSSRAMRSRWRPGRRWRCRSGRGEGSARTRARRRGSAPTDAVQAPHRPEPGLQPPVICPDRVVRVLLHGVQRRRDQLAGDPRADRDTAGGDLGRDLSCAQVRSQE